MKKILRIIIICICSIMLAACGNSSEHVGESKTPSGSKIMKGRDYQSVVETFEENGFTNIKLEKIDDLVTGWLTKDGEVEEVSVGGDFDYSPDKWVPSDIEVVVRYHTFPEEVADVTEPKVVDEADGITESEVADESQENSMEQANETEEVLNTDNCQELVAILSNKAEIDESYSNFAEKNKGRIIEFDGRIDYIVNHGDYDTRYDILVSAGDYDPDHQIGPTFKFENVGVYDLNLDTLYLEDEIKVGKNVRIVAKVIKFDSNSGLFFLDSMSVIDR